MKYIDDEVPKYRKKSNKPHTKKSDHKHESAYCVFEYPSFFSTKPTISIGTYCPTCGRVREIRVHDDRYTELVPSSFSSNYHREWNSLAKAEFNSYTRSLPFFKLPNSWGNKYVHVEDNK